MGLFGWLGESFNPGSVGAIDTNKEPLFKDQPERGRFLFFMFFGWFLFLGWLWFIGSSVDKVNVAILFILYLCGSYFVTPKPDTSNVGWLGGLIDHPFRISDDRNRFLVFFYLLLLPGQINGICYATISQAD